VTAQNSLSQTALRCQAFLPAVAESRLLRGQGRLEKGRQCSGPCRRPFWILVGTNAILMMSELMMKRKAQLDGLRGIAFSHKPWSCPSPGLEFKPRNRQSNG
jgi:hypothetical protein